MQIGNIEISARNGKISARNGGFEVIELNHKQNTRGNINPNSNANPKEGGNKSG